MSHKRKFKQKPIIRSYKHSAFRSRRMMKKGMKSVWKGIDKRIEKSIKRMPKTNMPKVR